MISKISLQLKRPSSKFQKTKSKDQGALLKYFDDFLYFLKTNKEKGDVFQIKDISKNFDWKLKQIEKRRRISDSIGFLEGLGIIQKIPRSHKCKFNGTYDPNIDCFKERSLARYTNFAFGFIIEWKNSQKQDFSFGELHEKLFEVMNKIDYFPQSVKNSGWVTIKKVLEQNKQFQGEKQIMKMNQLKKNCRRRVYEIIEHMQAIGFIKKINSKQFKIMEFRH